MLPSVHLSDLSNIYLSYRAKQLRQTQTSLSYAIQLYHKQEREYMWRFGCIHPSAD